MQRKPSFDTVKSTLFAASQQRQMEYKGGHWLVHEECNVHTAVYQKTPLGLKQC